MQRSGTWGEATSLTAKPACPKRGEIWWVDLDPTVGAEIRKRRPAVVVSSDAVGKLPLKLIAPITEWKDAFAGNIWHVRIGPGPANGLDKASVVDVLQLRGVDTRRLVSRMGQVTASQMAEVAAAIAAVVEYP